MAAVTAMTAKSIADTPDGTSRLGTSTLVLPDLPVKTPPVHEGQRQMTAADAALNGAQLLEVARGDPPLTRCTEHRSHFHLREEWPPTGTPRPREMEEQLYS